MSKFREKLYSISALKGARAGHFFLGACFIFSSVFVYWQTEKRIVNFSGETPYDIHRQNALEVNTSLKPEANQQLSGTALPAVIDPIVVPKKKDPGRITPNLKFQAEQTAFSSFNDWIKEYELANCNDPLVCTTHDPRYLRALLAKGENLSRTRAKEMVNLIRTTPQKALQLAIPREIRQKLPTSISQNIEIWENELVDVKAWHSCNLKTHQLCDIEKKVLFPDGRSMELYAYGKRQDLKTMDGLSAWGISLDGHFAMSENALRRINPSSETGKIEFAGRKLSYTSQAQINYFEELVARAENQGRRSRGKISYPFVMGSDGSLHHYLREKYELFPAPVPFNDAYMTALGRFSTDETYPEMDRDDNFGVHDGRHYAGYTERPGRKLLQIESQAENDYVVELLNDYFGRAVEVSPFVWLGASQDPAQIGLAYDRKNAMARFPPLGNWGASAGNWFWLDGRALTFTYQNWSLNPGTDTHAALDWRTTQTWVSRDPISTGSVVLEKNLPFEIGSIPATPSGTRKVLVVPARFEDQTTKMRSAVDSYTNWLLERNHLLTNEFGELINEDVYTEPFEPITRAELETLMHEVKEFYLRNTDQDLNLIPVITPTVTIPFRIRDMGGSIPGSGVHESDTEGTETGFDRVDYFRGNPVLDFAEFAMIQAGRESEEWDFYGPAFVGVAEIKLHQPHGNYSLDNLPLVTLQGGEYVNPNTLLPHARFKPAVLEPVLNEDGNLTSIRIVDTGAYYFDPAFGANLDSGGRSIFDYNYTVDDIEPVESSRSALHEFRDLCQKLDVTGPLGLPDGIADYTTTTGIQPQLLVDGIALNPNDYSIEINNVCLSWVGLTNYEHYEPVSEGLAWYGAPGVHVIAREGSTSSATIAHELGHNFGLLHAQRYASRGEQVLSDEGTKIAYGNPYSVMGSAPTITNGLGDLTLAEKLFLYDNFDGQAGYVPGLMKGCDVLDLNNATDLGITNLKEAGIPNKFRIYRSNSPSPPLALREANFSLDFPQEVEEMLEEYFGEANYSNSPNPPSSAHDFNQTASDLNKTIRLKVIGSGENTVANLLFRQGLPPLLSISDGGRGFISEPSLKILEEDNKTELLTIDHSWIRELAPNNHLVGRLFDHNNSDRWIRGVRISASPSSHSPTGLDVPDALRRYYLSYRSDISSTGLVILSSNNPDINKTFTRDRDYFYTQSEAFLLDATPQTPNDYLDAPLLIGTTYSDHDSDIHITPTAYGGVIDLDAMKQAIDQKREQVIALESANQELRQIVSGNDQALINANAELLSTQTQVDVQTQLIADYAALGLEDTELYAEAVEQLAILNALLLLREAETAGFSAQLESSFVQLEENQLSLDNENRELETMAQAYNVEQDTLYQYIEVVVNIGTVADGSAQPPEFEMKTTSQTPEVGERVTIRAMVVDGNTTGYTYAWFINEKPFNDADQLNKPVISAEFSQSGHYVIRVVVSDMKGGVSSRNMVISVGDAEKINKSLVTGTVRSTEGFLQGARVVIEEAPIIEHNLSMAGVLQSSYFPSGEAEPASFRVDGEPAPELTFHRGEVHRFYFDKSLTDYNISFLEKPENNPPRFNIHMLTDPRVSGAGNAYFRNPDINYTTRSAFSSYLSRKTTSYLEMLEYLQSHQNMTTGGTMWSNLHEANDSGNAVNVNERYLDLLEYATGAGITRFNDINGVRKEMQVMRPYPKVLLSETSVTKGIVGPVYANELGYITYGGRGYDRNDTPRVDVRRSSIWEDYFGNSNATAIAHVDGVGTISPVNAVRVNQSSISTADADFLGSTWALRFESNPPVPDLVVWGTGGGDSEDPLSEVNATVTAWTVPTYNHNVRTINIYNQGKGFEPNGTMAVLHYPRDPFAYWSFDRHETLFEDKAEARHQPSPAWNRELAGLGDRLKHHWKMDEDVNGATNSLLNDINNSANFNIRAGGAGSPVSSWGLLGQAVGLDGTRELNVSGVLPDDGNFTLSFWVNLDAASDLNLTVGGIPLNYSDVSKQAELGGAGGLSLTRGDTFNSWMHLAVSYDGNMSLYQDGRTDTAVFIPSGRDLEFTNLEGLIDEIKIYDVALSEAQVRYLSGRNYLDLSGNKYHATPVAGGGSDFIPVSPEAVPDVPAEFSHPNTPVIGTQIMNLGDSFPAEDHGRSLEFDGLNDHLDVSSHLLEFGLPEGTICMWIKTTTSNLAPLVWMSSPLEVTIIEVEEQNTSETIITPGSFFAMELLNGMPRLAGVSAFAQTSKVNDGQWHHIAASFGSAGNIWVDGSPVATSLYDTEDILFRGAQTTLEFIGDATEFYIGRAPDRTEPNTYSTFNGRLDDVIVYDRVLTNDEISYLYELRRGREQIPRLEAVVDAIGTVEITDGGAGYRENPDLVFWYGANNETKQDLIIQETNQSDLRQNHAYPTVTQGDLGYVTGEDTAYSFHLGKDGARSYTWRMGTDNDWRIHSAAAGIGEFGDPESLDPDVSDVVWTKKLDIVTTIPLPDGRLDKRSYVDYVTLDVNLASASVINNAPPHPYFKPNGLAGFAETPQFMIDSPEVYNPDARPQYTASAYALYHIDHDQNDSLTIVDGGSGFDVPRSGFELIDQTTGEPFSVLQFMVSGTGFKPTEYVPYKHTYGYSSGIEYFELASQDRGGSNTITEGAGYIESNDPQNYFRGKAWDPILDWNHFTPTVNFIRTNDPFNLPVPIARVTIDASETEVNKTVESIAIESAGFGYAMPVELKVVGGRPMLDARILSGSPHSAAPVVGLIDLYEAALGLDSVIVTANTSGQASGNLTLSRGKYVFRDAEFNVTKIDSNGSLLEGIYRTGGGVANIGGVEILDGGLGYIPYTHLPKTDPYADTSFLNMDLMLDSKHEKWYAAPNPPIDFHLNEYPFVSVSGGGGYGAVIRINEINATGGIVEIEVIDGGRGYFNIDPTNIPSVSFANPVALPDEIEANLSVRLGGSLKEIPPCTGCSSGVHLSDEYTYSHLEPWIEIWDRGRSEAAIDAYDANREGFPRVRAHAAPKVVDGKITKVVVTNSGSGYIDPVAIVRDAPPKYEAYNTKPNEYNGRNWRCTFIRTNNDGQDEECGHLVSSLYPPDDCPGETDDTLPYADENGTVIIATGDEISAWIQRHANECINHADNPSHSAVQFVSRKCWGTKLNYVLQNPIYRIDGNEVNQTWAPFDANLSVVSKDGRILRIEVMNEGRDYFASKLTVEGSGTGVDAIPVFNEYGINTRVIFDDPRLFNDELDDLSYRSGSGQGFRERPWSWDDDYNSTFGGREKVKVYAWHSEVITHEGGLSHGAWNWNFGDPVLNDSLGDRVVAIDINDPGIYASDFDGDTFADLNLSAIQIDYNTTVDFHDPTNPTGPSLATIDFNSTDHDGNGYVDFSQAQATMEATYTISRTLLNHPGTYSSNNLVHGLFTENPVLEFYDERNLNGWGFRTDYIDETASDYIRLNQKVTYDPEKDLSYIELFIDDRFPNQLYYGLDLTVGDNNDTRVLPRFGNVIRVAEGLPGMNWARDEPTVKKKFSYTDANGFYALSGLDPGFYNVAVFMEDQKLQDSSFRPDSNPSRVSQILYLSGFPELILETDQHGPGRSTLVWSPESRRLSRPSEDMDYSSEYDYEYRVIKRLEGIGRGFDPASPPPELTIIADSQNIGLTPPNIEVNVSVDGSLTLRIIDDENTSRYSPHDKFTVFHNTQVSNLDFVETHLYSESNQTFSFGSKADATPGVGKFILLPNDGNGTNPVSVPVSTFEREWNTTTLSWDYVFRERPFQLRSIAYDENGSSVSTSSVEWSANLDFNSSEGNNSRVIQLENIDGTRGLDINGSQINVYLFSLLRKGRVDDLEIIEPGQNYTAGSLIRLAGEGTGFLAHITAVSLEGEIQAIEVLNPGEKYSYHASPYVVDIQGSGAILRPVLPYSGTVRIDANITLPGASSITTKSIYIKPSLKYPLDSLESWRNKYTDSFWADANAPGWIQAYLSDDPDNDLLPNEDEWKAGTNPLEGDTDNDGIDDQTEVVTYKTNPWLPDTDGDGLPDSNETIGSVSNPLLVDSDKDGIRDDEDPNPLLPDGSGVISGLVIKKSIYDDNYPVYFDCGPYSPAPTAWDSNWTKRINNFYLTGKTPADYTLRAFVDFPPHNHLYDDGEPYAEQNITLTSQAIDSMGNYLVPVDPPPTIKFFAIPIESSYAVNSADFLERNVTIDVNDTNSLNSFAFAVVAEDPFFPGTTYTDVNVSFSLGETVNNVEFLVEGNFTQFLDLNESRADFNSTAVFDLNNTPIGNYQLKYRAVDEYGNISNEIVQNIEIKDTQPPYISILDIENGKGVSTFSITELNTVIPNINFDLNESNRSVVWKWPYGEPLELIDQSLAQAYENTLIVHVMDTKNEVLTDWSVNYEFNDTNLSTPITGQQIEDLNLTYLIKSGSIDTNLIGTHKLEFNATDRSGNLLDFTMYLLVEPSYQSSITAVDGYLENAIVGFDADGDGLSDLDRQFLTNSFGQADIFFTESEFKRFDTNENGRLDPSEGKFVVMGGMDTSTGSMFSGKLFADANSTVVSPLTTLISQLMSSGLNKEQATARVATSLGIRTDIDLTTYDPIQKAFEGDENATHIMMANLRMANLINQSEGLLRALSSDYEGFEVGTDLLNEVANWISRQNESELLDLEDALVDAIPVALASVGTAGELSIDDQLAMFQLMTELDSTFSGLEANLQFDELMAEQVSFIQSLEELVIDLDDKLPAPKHFNLELNSSEGGSTLGAGRYQYGSKVSIVATPDEHYRFVRWEGEGLENAYAKNTMVVMTVDRNVTALFEPVLYELAVETGRGGFVEGAGNYPFGEIVSLRALPDSGYTFLRWSGPGINEYTQPVFILEINGSSNFTAEFERSEISLILEAQAGGRVFGSGNYYFGEKVFITAFPDEGYVFSKWTGEGIEDPTSPSTSLHFTEGATLTAEFLVADSASKNLAIRALPAVGGSATGSGEYAGGTQVAITATPSNGYEFAYWATEDGTEISNNSVASYTIENSSIIHAHFNPKTFALSIADNQHGELLGEGIYNYGELVQIFAVPVDGYKFVRWEGDAISEPFNPQTTVLINTSAEITAVFEPLQATLLVSADYGGYVAGGGNYNIGEIAQLNAVPATGYRFVQWQEEAYEHLNSSRILVEMNASRSIIAKFELINNFFTPVGQDFYQLISSKHLLSGQEIKTLEATDGDGSVITFELVSGNPDLDGDNAGMFDLTPEGKLRIYDTDEIARAAGTKFSILVSIKDTGGRSSQVQGIIEIANHLLLGSLPLGNSWYDSNWLGKFFWESGSWVYHLPLGWMYVQPSKNDSYWLWNHQFEMWLWTDENLFPQAYSGLGAKWLYFHLDAENIRVFDYDHQTWGLLK